jgi:hypothetical protein
MATAVVAQSRDSADTVRFAKLERVFGAAMRAGDRCTRTPSWSWRGLYGVSLYHNSMPSTAALPMRHTRRDVIGKAPLQFTGYGTLFVTQILMRRDSAKAMRVSWQN